MKPVRISIDGTAGAGKSTLGEHLARRLGYLYVDTGAMYRALSWLALSRNVDIHDGPSLARLAEHTEIVIARPLLDDDRPYIVMADGRDVTWHLRDATVTHSVASVSRHAEVRALLITRQRAMAQREGVVMVGRDIGTVVLPDAELKVFLDAHPKIRARRRYLELMKQRGENDRAIVSMDEVLQAMMRRDAMDRANMLPAKDAVVILTDHLKAEQVLEMICQKLREREVVVSLRAR